MGRKARVDHEELARLVGEGWSNAELAERFGVTESGVSQAKRAAGLAKRMTDHRGALPWKLNREHNQTGPATNLRNLSSVAQGRTISRDKLNTALRWAERLVRSGLDVAYEPEKGFFEVPAGKSPHIVAVLEAARARLPSDSGAP